MEKQEQIAKVDKGAEIKERKVSTKVKKVIVKKVISKSVISQDKKIKKKKKFHLVQRGKVYIKATYNNTIINITDLTGNSIGWSSAGVLGFKGPKKATPYVATLIIKDILEKIKNYQLKEIDILVKGVGSGRDAAIRALHSQGLIINNIKDITPIPHNGCRPPKQRRV